MPSTLGLNAHQNRARALMGCQAQFDRYNKIVEASGYKGHDLHLMSDLKLLDASLAPTAPLSSGSSGHGDSINGNSSQDCPSSGTTARPTMTTNVSSPTMPGVLSTAVFSLLIDEKYGNVNGVLHGGAVGVILDMVTTAAVGPLAKPGQWEFLAGVTRTMNVNYLKPVPIGTLVHVHGHVHGLGKTMALIKGYITSPDGGTMYVTCDVNKVNTPARPEHMAHRVAWDDMWDDIKNSKL